jgi:hypothetical protein
MKPDQFETPVTVLTGLGLPTPVRSVIEAYRLLSEWPSLYRDPAHQVALKACKAALNREIETKTARSVFVAFAEKHDLLAPDLIIAPALSSTCGSDPHTR